MPESKHPSYPRMHSVHSLSATTHARSSFWLSSCLYSFNNDFLLDPAVPRPPTRGTLRNLKHTSNCPIRCSMSSCTASLILIAQSVARQLHLPVECNRGNANGGSSHFCPSRSNAASYDSSGKCEDAAALTSPQLPGTGSLTLPFH